MHVPRSFTSKDLTGRTVWAVTLDHTLTGYDVDAKIGESRWRGFVTRDGRSFVLFDREGIVVGSFRNLGDLAERAALLARQRERARQRRTLLEG